LEPTTAIAAIPIFAALFFVAVMPHIIVRNGFSIVILLQFLYTSLFLSWEIIWFTSDLWNEYDSFSVLVWTLLETMPFVIFTAGEYGKKR
jgi:hypothetical protein